MTQNQGEAGSFGQLGRRVAPWRERASSGMRLSVPPPLPSIRRPPPDPRAPPNIDAIDANWDDEKEDAATDVYAERVTLVFKRDAMGDDESTHEIPRATLPRLPALPLPSSPPPRLSPAFVAASPPPVYSPPPSRPSAPSGFEKLSRSLAAASLAPHGFMAALAHANERAHEVWAPPPRLAIPPMRVGWAVAAAALVAIIAFGHKPPQGTIVVDATDTRGAPVHRLAVLVDGEKTLCDEAPCSVPSVKGLHEVRVMAEGFGVPATQAVAVASGNPTAAHFIVAATNESVTPASGWQDTVKPAVAVESAAIAPVTTATPVMAAPAPAPSYVATPQPPAYPTPAPPAAKASPARSSGAGAPGGFLNINSMPASSSFLDGKALGSTPRLHVEVSAGSHTVRFRAPDGSTKTVVVHVGAGETALAVARLK
jgi:hypothetical protein